MHASDSYMGLFAAIDEWIPGF